MAIKKAQANLDVNGTGAFDTIHYETQIKQVKVVDTTGNVTGDLDTELTTIRNDIDVVDAKVDNTNINVSSLGTKVGDTATLTTVEKTVIPAINEVKLKADTNKTKIDDLTTRVTQAENEIDTHNHDTVYLKLSGGVITGDIITSNDKGLRTRNTSGVSLNIGKVSASNVMTIGDTSIRTVINANGGNLKVFNGTSEYEVFHSGNMGAGSGLDADMLDGVNGATYARKDSVNYFTQSQVIDNGQHIYLESADGSEQAGSLVWRNGSGTQKGKLSVGTGGDISVTAGTIHGHTFKATGELESTYHHIMDASAREVNLRFKYASSDAGMGLYMNNSSKQLGIYDWQNGKTLMTSNRADGTLNFPNGIEIQNNRIWVQAGQPSSPEVGDIWFDI